MDITVIRRTACNLSALLICIFITACQPAPTKPPADSVEAMTLSSDLVIVGKVLQNHSRWSNGHIITTSSVQPLQTLKGETGGATLRVSFTGGRVGNIHEHIEHAPALEEGQIAVLFLASREQPADKTAAGFRIVSDQGSITLVHPWERESRLTNNRRLIRKLEGISTRVQKAGAVK